MKTICQRVRMPMDMRVHVARQAIDEHKPYNQSQLANTLGWNTSTVGRMCNYEPDLFRLLNANRPPKKERKRRAPVKPANLHPVIQHLYDYMEESPGTYKEVAAKSGMSQQFFRDMFIGGSLPSMNSLLSVCGAMGLEVKLVKPDNS